MINILRKKKNLIIGLNSGTSADALDMALVACHRKGESCSTKFVCGKEKKYPQDLKDAILSICDSPKPSVDEIIYLNHILGKFYSKALKSYITNLKKKNLIVDAVASHGQTIRHLPKKVKRFGMNVNGTFQIGSAEHIAQLCNLPVVSDFRQADIVAGGEGAPITTGAMYQLFASSKDSKLIINIGGMSNYFYLPQKLSNKMMSAQDCGPGNVLSDLLMQKLYNKPYDKNGSIARSGSISQSLLSYFTAVLFGTKKEKSTGRELYGLKLAEKMVHQGKKLKLSSADMVATVIEFTAISIFYSIKRLIKSENIQKLYLTGGGRKNIFLVERLQQYLPTCQIENIDTEGIDGDFVEATAYAVMGEASLFGKALPSLNNNKNLVYGKINLPPQVV